MHGWMDGWRRFTSFSPVFQSFQDDRSVKNERPRAVDPRLRLKIFPPSGLELWANGWMDDLRFYVLFNSISVISGRWADDNERLCAMEPRLRLRRFCLERGSNSGPLDQ